MRWGVGKGRFRNLTAVVLSGFLAVLFFVVWQFVRSIEPLAVDNTPRAVTATIRDRLLHPKEDSTLRVTATSLRLFCNIADSVHRVFRDSFPIGMRRGSSWTEDSSQVLLQRTQMLCRRQVARALNSSYVHISTYEHCQAAVISELIDQTLRVSVAPAELSRMQIVRNAIETFRSVNVGVSEPERAMIRELSYYLVPRLYPFVIGLAGDDISYSATPTRVTTKK